MNTHIPQSIETAYELQELTAVPTQIISPASSEPIIEVKEDTLTAAYLFTLPHMHLSKKEVYNLLMTNEKFTGELPKPQADGRWTGQRNRRRDAAGVHPLAAAVEHLPALRAGPMVQPAGAQAVPRPSVLLSLRRRFSGLLPVQG